MASPYYTPIGNGMIYTNTGNIIMNMNMHTYTPYTYTHMKKIVKPLIGVFYETDQLDRIIRPAHGKYIHMAMASPSIKRHNTNYVIYIDMEKAMNDGIIFYEENGEILTEGIDGIFPARYFSSIDYL
jgi:hypothetical protein